MPSHDSEHIRSIAANIILTLVTCGLYKIYWQYLQMQSVNERLEENKYGFWPWLLFTLITCGIYHGPRVPDERGYRPQHGTRSEEC